MGKKRILEDAKLQAVMDLLSGGFRSGTQQRWTRVSPYTCGKVPKAQAALTHRQFGAYFQSASFKV